MPRITISEFKNYLDRLNDHSGKINKTGKIQPESVYLIFGDEMLYKTALEKLLNLLVPGEKRSLNYEPIEGSPENIHQAIESVNTYSLLPGNKVVALLDSKIFSSKQDRGNIIDKARQAYESDHLKKAAGYILNLMGNLGLTLEDAANEKALQSKIKIEDGGSDYGWLNDIMSFCVENKLSVPDRQGHEALLLKAIENGFPKGHYFIITTDLIDKRRSFFRNIEKKGLVVDCSVPRGDRRADKVTQEAVLNEEKKSVLSQYGKTMEREASKALYEMTGFDLRTYTSNLKKLVTFVGDRKQITVEDVEFVLKRTKTDPIYAFTNAVTDKNLQDAVYYMDSLLSDGQKPIRPEQIVVAIANQIRMLIMIKGFTMSNKGGVWYSGCSYQYFKNNVMIAIKEYDHQLLNHMDKLEKILTQKDEEDGKPQKGMKKKGKHISSLLIAKNTYNPYPVFQMLKKSEKFSEAQLIDAFEQLRMADLRIKTYGGNKKLILEKILLNICQ